MGLDTTHGAWHGAYSSFMRFRRELAERAGFPPLDLMAGFFGGFDSILRKEVQKEFGGIPWDFTGRLIPEYRGLIVLLSHSDCDGEIEVKDLPPLRNALAYVLEHRCGDADDDFKQRVAQFIEGCDLAAEHVAALKAHIMGMPEND